jgi:probable phosphoglycerate mutase
MPSTYLYLIRHGDSAKQHNGIIGGPRGDTGLTPLGVRQVEHLRDRLLATGEIRADVVLASPLPRAWQTAEILAPVWGLPLVAAADFEEIHKGAADGLSRAEAHARYGAPDFARAPFRPIAPGGEYWGAFVLRATRALTGAVHAHAGRRIVIVCHGGIIHAAFHAFWGLPTLAPLPAWFATANASLTIWRAEGDVDRLSWHLVRYNDVAHLPGDATGERLNWEVLDTRRAETMIQPSRE